jgi:hypothetical protein
MHESKHAALSHLHPDEKARLLALSMEVGLPLDQFVNVALKRIPGLPVVQAQADRLGSVILGKLTRFPRDCPGCARIVAHNALVECIFCHRHGQCGVCESGEGCAGCRAARVVQAARLRPLGDVQP